MSQQFLSKLCLTLCLATWSTITAQQPQELAAGKRPIAFADGGKFKMLYDCRQRPQSVLVNNRLYLVYNGDARRSKNGNGSAYPMLITYRPADRSFSKPVRLSQNGAAIIMTAPSSGLTKITTYMYFLAATKPRGPISSHPNRSKLTASKSTGRKARKSLPRSRIRPSTEFMTTGK